MCSMTSILASVQVAHAFVRVDSEHDIGSVGVDLVFAVPLASGANSKQGRG